NFRWLASLGRNAQIKLVTRGKKERRARADCRRNSLDQGVVVRIVHLVDADRGLAAGNVDSFAGCIKKEIVGVARSAHPRDLSTRLRVQNYQHRRLPSDRTEPVLAVIALRGKVSTV